MAWKGPVAPLAGQGKATGVAARQLVDSFN